MSIEKAAYCHFFEFLSCFASRIRSRAAKPAKYENLWVFIRFDAHVVKAGINLRGRTFWGGRFKLNELVDFPCSMAYTPLRRRQPL